MVTLSYGKKTHKCSCYNGHLKCKDTCSQWGCDSVKEDKEMESFNKDSFYDRNEGTYDET